ncbi:MAG TPA: hypothetical protein ENH50_05270 [Nitrospirae bacterium]|nr:hypothetical protein [Nitrospirota bacterium]
MIILKELPSKFSQAEQEIPFGTDIFPRAILVASSALSTLHISSETSPGMKISSALSVRTSLFSLRAAISFFSAPISFRKSFSANRSLLS